ncbi:MAG TPA: manganese efflux pump [Candidatus Saccharimonadales bacterium]|nr:manganese efflux pump [Candidatus Saccharimonadales bacterium]
MLLKLIVLTLPLCIDSFLICSAIGISKPSRQTKVRLSLTFAVFEGGMPLIGLAIGSLLSQGLGDAAQYLAGGILLVFGAYSLLATKREDTDAKRLSEAHGFTLIALGLGISIDSLAVGFSYGLLKIPPLWATIAIVTQTLIATQVGFALGNVLPVKLRVWGESLASLVLALIGGFIIFSKIVG